MDGSDRAYFDALAAQLVGAVSAAEQISQFTSNKTVVGAFAESLVYQFVNRIVHPLRLSSGTVISPDAYRDKKDTPQFDLIIWDPNPIPSIAAEDRFALVPRNSVLGIIEIKKTDYDRGLDDIEDKASKTSLCFPHGAPELFLGVICAATVHDPEGDNKLTKLINAKRAVYLLDFRRAEPQANSEGVYRLINFLARVRRTAKQREAVFSVNYPGSTWE